MRSMTLEGRRPLCRAILRGSGSALAPQDDGTEIRGLRRSRLRMTAFVLFRAPNRFFGQTLRITPLFGEVREADVPRMRCGMQCRAAEPGPFQRRHLRTGLARPAFAAVPALRCTA